MLVSQNVPNLINGVSQQAEAQRFPSQCVEQVNFLPSLLKGLSKRPPTAHRAVLASGADLLSGPYGVHKIDRSASERFLAHLGDGALRVFDLNGVEQSVSGSFNYLDCDDPLTQLRTLTVADYTFVLNTSKVVEAGPQSPSNARDPEALIFTKLVGDGADYTLRLYNDPAGASPDYTASLSDVKLTSASTFSGTVVADQGGVALALGSALVVAGANVHYTISRSGELLYIKKADGSDFRVEVESSLPNGLCAFKDSVQSFALLPKRGWANFRIQVKGDPDDAGDDYYLRFVAQDANATEFAEGTWEESQASELDDDALDPSTLPHALIYNGSSFSFEPLTWLDRACGDQDTNPAPSFVGQTVEDVFFHKNRLGLLTGENMVLSCAGDFFNFWRTTVIQLLDSDVIDVAAESDGSGSLRNARSISERLALFSDRAQFRVDEGDLLTPKTAGIKQTNQFSSTAAVRPEATKSAIYFPFTRGRSSGFIEYSVPEGGSLFTGADITEHVPNYITGTVQSFVASDTASAILAKATADDTLYLYKFFRDEQGRRVQSSWSKLRFNGVLRGFQVFDSLLYLVLVRNNEVVLESLDLAPGVLDTNLDGEQVFVTHLDRRVTEADVTVAYNATTHRTTYTLPYTPAADDIRVASRGDAYGNSFTVLDVTGNVVTIGGDKSDEPVWIGEVFRSEQTLTRPALRETNSDGSITINTGRFQVRTGTITADESLDFRVEVTPTGRSTFVYRFASRVLGTLSAVAGAPLVPRSAPMRFTVNSKNDQVTIKLVNDSHLPCHLLSVDWEALYVVRSQRV